ncbi:MAG: sulfatase-like hydrolase/transferase [Verrucomicrobiota bacterium]
MKCSYSIVVAASLLGVISGPVPSLFAEVEAREKPNVILMFADDLGYGDVGCYGATKVATPNIDRLAAEGRRFTDAHSASAVCTPSRYGLLTGEYPSRKGIWGPCSHTQPLLIDTKKLTLGQLFKNEDYATAVIGKWHLGFGEGKTDWNKPLRPGPLELGFDYYFGIPKVNSGFPYVYVENDRIVGYDPEDPLVYGKPPFSKTTTYPEATAGRKSANKFSGAKEAHEIYDDERTGTLLTEKAVTWIEANKEKPFFLYFPTPNIHHPFTPADQFKGTSEAGLYGDFIHEFDWMVGELMKCLEKNGLTENTLIIVTSDNGGMFNFGGQHAFDQGHRINGDLLGFKFGVWEGGHRVPFIAKWPGKIEAGTTSDQLISGIDMLATFAALTEQEVEAEQLADSINVLPAFVDDPETSLRETLLLCPNKRSHLSLRQGKWVYIPAQGGGGFTGGVGVHAGGGPKAVTAVGSPNSDIADGEVKSGAPAAQLYDLEADVSQTTNVILEHPEVAEKMKAALAEYAPAKQVRKKPAGSKAKTSIPENSPAKKEASSRESAKTAKTRSGAPSGAPNVIFMLTDDLGYSDISCYGAKKVKTPHLDRLAAEGMMFMDFHTAASICSPSRAAFLTGAYPQRAGLYMGINPGRTAHWYLGLNPDEITITEQFKQQGYQTHMVGKWHLGTEPEFLPRKQGFDTYYGMPCNFNHSRKFFDGDEEIYATTPLDQLTRLYTDRVTKIVKEAGDEPFFLYYSHNFPHSPIAASDAFKGSSKGGLRGDMIQEMDWGVGEMMKALEEAGIAENTIVIFTSDNGPTANAFAKPYRGTKYVTFEGGHRVPFIFHWPSQITEGGVSEVNINAMDLFPTLVEIIDAPMPSDRVYDGESLLPLLSGKELKRSADAPFYFYNCENLQAVRSGDWKLHLPRSQEQLPFWEKNKTFANLEQPVLYHLGNDRSETTDVSESNPEVVEELLKLAESAREELGEYMQRGIGQRPTGSLFPDYPVISNEKDWGMMPVEAVESIWVEREARHPGAASKRKKRKAARAE